MKASYLFGILILLLYSASFGQKNTEFWFVAPDATSDNGDSSRYIKSTFFSEVNDMKISQPVQADFPVNDGLTAMIAVDPGICAFGHILNDNTSVCAGTVIELESKPALSYHWSPGYGLNDLTIQNPWVIIDSTRTFYLYTTEYSENLIVNPDFEMGNTGFETDYTYCNSNNCLLALGDNGYAVGADASFFVNTYFSGHDHTTGSGDFMIVNGGRSSLKVWRQTIPVTPNTTYTFGLWISRMNYYDTAQIRVTINGSQLGAIFTPPVVTNIWQRVLRTWNSGMQTTATIEIVDMKTSVVGNDFGLDDITFGEIIACKDSVTITASKNVNLGQDTVISPGQQLVLTPTGGPFEHYNWNNGDTTQSILINEAGKYWLHAKDPIGCDSYDTIIVRSDNSFVIFPNAFTPNADGKNDIFRPRSNNVVKFNMAIYNRWGQILFETNNVEDGWDGKLAGNDCAVGLYVYVASYEYRYQEETKTIRGSFSLIR